MPWKTLFNTPVRSQKPSFLIVRLFTGCFIAFMLLFLHDLSAQAADGKYTERYENGKVKVSGHYKSGLKKGNWFYYSASGLIEKRELWKHGDRVYTYTYNEKGRIASITDKNGKTTERAGCNCR